MGHCFSSRSPRDSRPSSPQEKEKKRSLSSSRASRTAKAQPEQPALQRSASSDSLELTVEDIGLNGNGNQLPEEHSGPSLQEHPTAPSDHEDRNHTDTLNNNNTEMVILSGAAVGGRNPTDSSASSGSGDSVCLPALNQSLPPQTQPPSTGTPRARCAHSLKGPQTASSASMETTGRVTAAAPSGPSGQSASCAHHSQHSSQCLCGHNSTKQSAANVSQQSHQSHCAQHSLYAARQRASSSKRSSVERLNKDSTRDPSVHVTAEQVQSALVAQRTREKQSEKEKAKLKEVRECSQCRESPRERGRRDGDRRETERSGCSVPGSRTNSLIRNGNLADGAGGGSDVAIQGPTAAGRLEDSCKTSQSTSKEVKLHLFQIFQINNESHYRK